MSFLYKLLSKTKHFTGGVTAYVILKPCKRCVYQKSYEPVLIYSLHRGPRVIVEPNGNCYVRVSECVKCNDLTECFRQVNLQSKCKWKKF